MQTIPFASGPLASLPLKITALQMNLVAAMHPAEHAHKWFALL